MKYIFLEEENVGKIKKNIGDLVCFRGLVTVLNINYFPTEGGAVKTSPGKHTVYFDEMLGDGGYENTIILITILIID